MIVEFPRTSSEVVPAQRPAVTIKITVDSQIIVFCVDPQPGEDPRTHVLGGVIAEADTPNAAVNTLATHVNILRQEIHRRGPSEFTKSPHATLVAGEKVQEEADLTP